MQDKIIYILTGSLISISLAFVFVVYLLFKKPTVKNEIKNLKQKNKRNKDTQNDNDINTSITSEKPQKRKKRGKERRIFTLKRKRND